MATVKTIITVFLVSILFANALGLIEEYKRAKKSAVRFRRIK